MSYIAYVDKRFYSEFLSEEERKNIKCRIDKLDSCDIYLFKTSDASSVYGGKDSNCASLTWILNLIQAYKYKVEYEDSNILITFQKENGLVLKDDIFGDLFGINPRNNKDQIEKEIRNIYKQIKNNIVLDFVKFNAGSIKYDIEEYIIIHLLQFYLLDKIIILNEDEMFHINSYEYKKQLNNKEVDFIFELNPSDIKTEFVNIRKVDLLGCYINKKQHNKAFIELLSTRKDLEKIELDNVICLCVDNMEFFMEQDAFKNESIIKLYETVLSHEIGHLIFSYLDLNIKNNNCTKFKERQANYFSSYVFLSDLDYFIYEVTKHQNSDYQNPLLISHKLELKDYDKLVRKLYKGEM